jgi:hypothetical protein
MVYEKWITKGGKKFGPYLYESYRDKDGKVKTRYISGPDDKSTVTKLLKPHLRVTLFTIGFLIILLTFSLMYLNYSDAKFISTENFDIESSVTGFATKFYSFITGFNVEETGSESSGGESSGDSGGDSGATSSSESVSSGDSGGDSSEASSSSDSGEASSETSTPSPAESTESSESPTEESSQETVEEPTETPAEEESTEEPTEETAEEPTEEQTLPEDPSTSNNEETDSSGTVEQEETVEESTDEQASGSEPEQEVNETQEIEEPEPIINETEEDTSDNITIENVTEVEINETIIDVNESIDEIEIPVNDSEEESEPDTNITLPEIEVNETLIETNITFNITTNVTLAVNETLNISLEETVQQYGAVIGEPVKWKKAVKIKIDGEGDEIIDDLEIELPEVAGNVTVIKVDSETGVQEELEEGKEEFDVIPDNLIMEKQARVVLTGNTITRFFSNFFAMFMGITGRAIDIVQGPDEVIVGVQENLTNNDEVIVEYYTEAPYSEEIIASDNSSKEITIKGPDELHYENVLAFTELPREVSSPAEIKLVWVTGNNSIAEFTSYDTNNNSLIDYIEWVVPHLSDQTYELTIIEITGAQHLDENKTFISDIFAEVNVEDGIWSEEISAGHFVRVTFEQELDSSKDITVVARTVGNNSNLSGTIEVYEQDGSEVIATIENINNGTYQTLLTELRGTQDTFDLKILGSSLEFDLIIDPTPSVSSVILSSTDGTNDTNQNLIATIVASDPDGDNITFWYGWYKDNVLNATTLIEDGLIAYWPLNNDTLDYWNNNNGTVIGATYNLSGKVGGAYEFDGDTSFINLSAPSSLDNLSDSSICAWIYLKGWNGAREIIYAKGTHPITISDYSFAVVDTYGGTSYNTTYFFVNHGLTVGTSLYAGGQINSVELNKWQHVCVTWNGTATAASIKLYHDGIETPSYSLANDASAARGSDAGEEAYIGAKRHGSGGRFNGTIDEVMIFNRSLSASEVKMLYEGARLGGDQLHHDQTTAGENWSLCITPNDGTEEGVEVCSNELGVLSSGDICPNNWLGSGTEADPCQVTECNNISFANMYYESQNDITGIIGTCFNITNNSITFDGNGKTITGNGSSTDYGIFVSGYNNITIKNFGNIPNFSSSIYLMESNNSVVQNNTIFSNFTGENYGIYAENINENLIYLNNIRLNSTKVAFDSSYGIYIEESSGTISGNNISHNNLVVIKNHFITGIRLKGSGLESTIIEFNNITAETTGSGITSYGLSLMGSSNIIRGNKINVSAVSGSSAVGVDTIGNGDSFTSNKVSCSSLTNARGILLGNNGLFLNNNVTVTASNAFSISDGNINTNTLAYNNSYGEIRWVKDDLDVVSNLTFPGTIAIGNNSAYFNALPNDNINSSANVTLRQNPGQGLSNPTIFKDGVSCGGNCYNFTPLTAETVVFNVSGFSNYSVGEEDSNTAPNTSLIILNSTLRNNYTNEDLRCYANITDDDGDTVYANYTWYKNSAKHISGQTSAFTSGTFNLISTLDAGNTTAGDNWTCGVFGYDGTSYETDENNGTAIEILPIPDNEYPVFSGFWDNNASLVSSGVALFNVTLLSTNGTVFLEIDGTNYTAENVTSDVYNVSVSLTSSGDYLYYWASWGNGTDSNYNVSGIRYYTINSSVVAAFCGDGTCNAGETCNDCQADCGVCGGGDPDPDPDPEPEPEPEPCVEDWTCGNWSVCVDSSQTRTCTDNNACGTEDDKPDESQSCVVPSCDVDGDCDDGNVCTDDSCIGGECSYSDNVDNCDDGLWCTINDQCGLGTCSGANRVCGEGETCDDDLDECVVGAPPEEDPVEGQTITIGTADCSSNWGCGDWSECSGEYTSDDLIYGREIIGTQGSLCKDFNGCQSNFFQERKCTFKVPVIVETKMWCNKEYTEVRNLSGSVLARLKTINNGADRLDVNLNLVGEGFCEYCYDDIQNYDEEGVDCGGSCMPCGIKKELPESAIRISVLKYWIFFTLFLTMLVGTLYYTVFNIIDAARKGEFTALWRKYRKWQKMGYDVSVLNPHMNKLS